MFGGITRYSLVLVHNIGTGKLWQNKRFGRQSGGGLMSIYCMCVLQLYEL